MRWLLTAAVLLPTTAFAQEACEDNTVRYGQHRETGFGAIALSPGGGIGQFYERPGAMDLVGMEIYAYGNNASTCNTVSTCNETANPSAFDLRAEVYLADSDGLPTGAAVVSRDITLPCVCDPTELDSIRERFTFSAIPLTGDYVVTIINTDSTDTVIVRTNSFNARDGEGEDLGRHLVFPFGGGPREWFPASDVTLGGGGVDADADVYVHPIITFDLDASFDVQGPRTDACIEAGEELFFEASDLIAASPVYNTDARADVSSSAWQFGDGSFGNGPSVSHLYAASEDRTVRHTLSFAGDTESCSTFVNQDIDAVVPYFFDCDQDGFTAGVGDVYCGTPVAVGGECAGIQTPLFELQDDGDCNDSDGAISPAATEVCDNVDNNCNDDVDDNVPDRPVAAPFGECSDDVEFCEAGNWLLDEDGNVGPMMEVCDGLDNDCNNTADDNVADVLTDNQVGACAGNTQECSNGQFQDSASNHVVSDEMCDGVDNDCDAQTEDGADEPQLGQDCDGDDADDCDGGVFTCTGGELTCSDGPELEDCGDPDTEPDTDPDSDTDSNPDPDTDVDSDTLDPGPVPATRCGCSSGPSGLSLFGFGLLLIGFVARRR